MWTHYNPNPAGRNVGDCTVRALSKALDQDWYTTYLGLCVEGGLMGDMPSANATWGAYLRRHGYRRELAPEDVTVAEFADSHPHGTYILALSGHVVCIRDCVLYDSWDSGNEIVLYFWERTD
jgi:hypothetical protein|nr:MAG TPA: hypothetical protein [Caudoviricetes sp.]